MSAQMAYAWKAGTRSPISAQVAGEEISRIRRERGDFFTASAVVAASEKPEAPLHKAFEWNDAKAGSLFRQEQAKYIIRHIVVMNSANKNELPTRAFVSVLSDDGDNKKKFTSLEHALSDDDLRYQVLGQAFADMQAFERKYSQYLDLSGVVKAFETARIRAMTMQPEQRAS